MAYELIPFPISVFFVAAFVLAWVAVLYKLRKRGKIYSVLFWASLVAGISLLGVLLLLTAGNMLSLSILACRRNFDFKNLIYTGLAG